MENYKVITPSNGTFTEIFPSKKAVEEKVKSWAEKHHVPVIVRSSSANQYIVICKHGRQSKFKTAIEIGTSLANAMSKHGEKDFRTYLELLKSFTENVHQGRQFQICKPGQQPNRSEIEERRKTLTKKMARL